VDLSALAQPGGLRTFSFSWGCLSRWQAVKTYVGSEEARDIADNSMKVLLRNIVTGQYYQGPSHWTPDPEAALDLKQTSKAVQLVFDSHLESVEVVLCYDDPRYNIVLPFDRSKPQK
jgi:hypothetical protein